MILAIGINYFDRTQPTIRIYNNNSYKSIKEKRGKCISLDSSLELMFHESRYSSMQLVCA